MSKIKYIGRQLVAHLPYSIFGVSMGLLVMGVLTFFSIILQAEHLMPGASGELFHIFHPVHILFSAATTTAMFWKHEKRVLRAIVVGFLGSIGICGVSDILFPFAGGIILGAKMHMHVCLFIHPGMIIPFALIGVLTGFFLSEAIEHSTQFSHSAHVLVSSMASILYLISFGVTHWIELFSGVFLVVLFSVVLPCCLSDIVCPLLCVHRGCAHPDILEGH